MSGLMDHEEKLLVTAGTNLGVQLSLGDYYVASEDIDAMKG